MISIGSTNSRRPARTNSLFARHSAPSFSSVTIDSQRALERTEMRRRRVQREKMKRRLVGKSIEGKHDSNNQYASHRCAALYSDSAHRFKLSKAGQHQQICLCGYSSHDDRRY